MLKAKVFCETCREDVAFTTDIKQLKGTVKGADYTYTGQKAHCIHCGSEIYVDQVNDFNLKALYDAYRKKNNIISLEDILAIADKYTIGKRPLSLLLGWGEQTFSRYCDGDIPTKQYSEILQKIYDDPYYYAKILESNKNNLPSTAAYEKSKKAVHAILGTDPGAKATIDLVIEYLLCQCEDITPLALQKALYYTQGFYFAFHQTFLFPEECEAWVHGPVYRDIYFKYRDYKFEPIEGHKKRDNFVFSSAKKAILDSIIKNICCYSGKTLEKFTHAEPPWLLTRGKLPVTTASNKIIPKDQIGDYFSAVKKNYNMVNPSDIKSYTQKMFNQI